MGHHWMRYQVPTFACQKISNYYIYSGCEIEEKLIVGLLERAQRFWDKWR